MQTASPLCGVNVAIYYLAIAFLIAWVVKVIILRWGGVNTYRNCVPFFVGLMVGHYAGRAVALGTTIISQQALML